MFFPLALPVALLTFKAGKLSRPYITKLKTIYNMDGII